MKEYSVLLILDFSAENKEKALQYARDNCAVFQDCIDNASIEIDELTLDEKSPPPSEDAPKLFGPTFPEVWW